MTRTALSLSVLVAACASRAPAAPVAPAHWPASVDAATPDAATPTDVPAAPTALTGVTRIVMSIDAHCALRADGTAWCWRGTARLSAPAGNLQPEQEPVGTFAVPGLHDIDALCLGVEAVCGRRRDGVVTCRTLRSAEVESPTGDGDDYRVDVMEGAVPGEPAERLDNAAGVCVITRRDGRRELVVPPRNRRDVWSRMTYSGSAPRCELREGAARCEGSNHGGLLANNETVTFSAASPSTLFGLRNLRDVRVGARHACAVTLDGAVLCWGQNLDGQLGTGDARSRALPTRVPGIDGVRAVRLGEAFTCALREAGDVWCWGAGRLQLFGDDTPAPRARPAPLRGSSGLTALETSDIALCGTRDDATAWCWYGLGIGPTGARPGEPQRVDLAR
jgi:hypothetical protein